MEKDITKICAICNHTFKYAERKRHLLKEHGLTFEEYVLQISFNNTRPKCKCGCGKDTKFNGCIEKGLFFTYLKGHSPNPPMSDESKRKMVESYKKTVREKYGVDNMFQLESIKQKCKETSLKNYGVDHPMKNKDVVKNVISTNINKYGTASPFQNTLIKEKINATHLKKYGVKHPMQSKEVRKKVIATNLEKYGCEYGLQNKDVQEKSKKTNLERYGVENVFSLDYIKDSIKITNQERYGVDYPTQSKEIFDKIKKSNREKYGSDYFMGTQEFKDKTKISFLNNYGVENIILIKDFKKIYCSKHSKIELKVLEALKGESAFWYKGKEYDIRVGNNLYEIDGDYFHSNNLTNLNIYQLNSTYNDDCKIKDIKRSSYKLYKIMVSNIPKEITEESLQKVSYIPNFELQYDDVIMSKEYIESYIQRNGLKGLEKQLKSFKNFIDYFQPFLKFQDVDSKILELWNDKSVLHQSIKEVIGLGESDEVRDFSVSNIVDNIQKTYNIQYL